jgi:hypothetical protein
MLLPKSGEDYVTRNLMICGKITKNEMGEACRTYGEDECTQGLMGNPEESDHLEDLVVYGRIM